MDTPRQSVSNISRYPETDAAADAVIDSLRSVGIHPAIALVSIAKALYKLSKAQEPRPGQEEAAKEWSEALYEVARNGEVK